MATVFVNVGKAFFARKGANLNNTAEPKFVGWGTGAGTAAAADTTLFTEATEARVIGVQTNITTTTTNDTYRLVGELTANGSKTITNAGYFDASTGGTLIVHADHTGIPLLLNDKIEYTFDLIFGAC